MSFKKSNKTMRLILAAVFSSTIMMGSWTAAAPDDPVVLEDLGSQVKLSNGKISFVAAKADATIRTMTLGSSPNLAGRGAYFAVADYIGLGADSRAERIEIHWPSGILQTLEDVDGDRILKVTEPD